MGGGGGPTGLPVSFTETGSFESPIPETADGAVPLSAVQVTNNNGTIVILAVHNTDDAGLQTFALATNPN